MNDKEYFLNKIVDIVVACTSSRINEVETITREDLLGKSRNENHVMARSLLAHQLKMEGYTVTTIALLLNRTEQSIRNLIESAYNNIKSSRVCRKAAAQIVLECEALLGE